MPYADRTPPWALNPGSIAGIAVGAVAAVGFAVGAALWSRTGRRDNAAAPTDPFLPVTDILSHALPSSSHAEYFHPLCTQKVASILIAAA